MVITAVTFFHVEITLLRSLLGCPRDLCGYLPGHRKILHWLNKDISQGQQSIKKLKNITKHWTTIKKQHNKNPISQCLAKRNASYYKLQNRSCLCCLCLYAAFSQHLSHVIQIENLTHASRCSIQEALRTRPRGVLNWWKCMLNYICWIMSTI